MDTTVLILGGDGFCGWPTALHLSRHGYHVVIIDNFSRRKIDVDLGLESLTPILPMEARLAAWRRASGNTIDFIMMDIAREYDRLLEVVRTMRPQAVVHFAEQRAAPYSMRDSACKRYTVNNNLNATHNVLCAIVESGLDVHLVHLGSMGVYGYATTQMPIPEGYLPVSIQAPDGSRVEREIMYPPAPGSVYHMTKTQDALFFYFYNKNDGIRITDLHQGIVWGTATDETGMSEALVNRFDYDGDYGTVLNRFLVQSVVGHPLTVHGTGGQTRAFIHIRDTVKCIKLAIENPPLPGERVKIFNQATETWSVKELATLVSRLTGCEARSYADPRKEDQENGLIVENGKFRSLGLKPVTLSEGLMNEVRDVVSRYRHRCTLTKIPCTSVWTAGQKTDTGGVPLTLA
ncbi:NAD-dependent epimerase/dehydratase family protein [uncultured Desulfovibrio sp.]|uniref:NAD-dependent epimerase/dehydratase family protein n=3 Tax=uncultured Desulfovibrio sp. TaxID=167968 RepID=UPI00261381F2|nr:NAD-dependent epimerase/dehydratase family protein [uncultured Desulfovibrio sp.]